MGFRFASLFPLGGLRKEGRAVPFVTHYVCIPYHSLPTVSLPFPR
jgi:hypothetical protein